MMHLLSLPLTMLALMSVGCVVMRTEGDQIQADLDHLRSDFSSLQKSEADSKKRLKQLENEVFQKLKRDAQSTGESERLHEELQSLRGQLEETQHQLQQIQQTNEKGAVNAAAPKETSASKLDIPGNREEHYKFAKQLFDRQDFSDAIDAFEQFSTRYKDTKALMDHVHFFIGEANYHLAKRAVGESEQKSYYKKAILAYQQLLSQFPSSPKVDETLYKVGLSLEAMGLKEDAIVFYQEIMEKHHKSDKAPLAKKRLNILTERQKRPKR